MSKRMAALAEIWQSAGPRERELLVARALGARVVREEPCVVQWPQGGEEALPPVLTSLTHAQKAMDRAWAMMEESAPLRVSCTVKRAADGKCHNCLVEWWFDDDTHIVTPNFATETESRAFAAYVFATLKRQGMGD